MRLLGITDLHGNHDALPRILAAAAEVDAILLGGDLTNFGTPGHAEKLVRRAQAAGAVLAVAGNCDSAEIDRRLVDLGVSLMGRGVIHQGVGLHGLSAMPPWLSNMYQFTEEQLAEVLEAGYGQIAGAEHHVVLSHPPPRVRALDRIARGENVGSTALRDFVDRTQPALVLCGHIHEGRGIERLGRTTVVNCGLAASGFYALATVGEQVDVELCRA